MHFWFRCYRNPIVNSNPALRHPALRETPQSTATVWMSPDRPASVAQRHPDAAVIVLPRCTVVLSDQAETLPTQRDRHLKCIDERGRMGWQQASGYSKRARVEASREANNQLSCAYVIEESDTLLSRPTFRSGLS